MKHQRSVIRQAIVRALVQARTRADGRVSDNPWNERTALPALVVEDLGEQQDVIGFGAGPGVAVERQFLLQVRAELAPLDDPAAARDELIGEVEATLAGAAIAGVKAIVPAGYQADGAEQGGTQVVVGLQRFQVTYITPMNNPAAAM